MAVKLHRCTTMWVKGPHPCWRVQNALDEAGIRYELVKHPWVPRSKRTAYIALTGQKGLPAIELEDGRVILESKDIIALIRAGRLEEGAPETAAGTS